MLTTFSDEYFMTEALKEAQKAFLKDEIPIGSVIVCENRIIARAHNFTETLKDVTAHAEMQAFTSASNFLGSKYLHNCTLYVTLEPCMMCAGASYWTQISKIIFGAHDLKNGYSIKSNSILHPKTQIIGGIMEKECLSILQNFFQQKRQKN